MLESFELLKQGGIVMIPLALCSIAAIATVVERALALRRNAVIDPGVVAALREFTPGSSPEGPLRVCRRARGAFARIIEAVLESRHQDRGQAIETMHAIGRTQVGGLERGLTLLEIIASTSPLLGLLGTVLGMVDVFNAITVQGLGNPQVLSGGISEALITTVAGLSVAIPALAFHSWFSRRVEDLAVEMHERGTAFLAKLYSGADTPPAT
jgi:biopolymer transport protein ExbB